MAWHIALGIDRCSAEPLSEQLAAQLRDMVGRGQLPPLVRLPSSRILAGDLKVSRSVVVEVYERLTGEGLLESVRGSGTRVAAHAGTRHSRPVALTDRVVPPVMYNMLPGIPRACTFPQREWLASYQRAVEVAGFQTLGYPPLLGMPALRAELVAYLGRMRGVHGTPEQVAVTNGFAQGLSLLCACLRRMGIDEMAVEDPSHDRQRHFIEQNGIRTLPIPVDGQGLDVARLEASGLRAVMVTPAHQFPRGVAMSAERQQALVQWARDTKGIIIEDDYDGGLWLEQRGRHLALQRLCPGNVVYAGTASKMLAPGIRLGWLVLPTHMVPVIEAVRARRDLGFDSLLQTAFADFLQSGQLDRHLRRMRTRNRLLHRSVVEALDEHLPAATIDSPVAGLHLCLQLPAGTDEAALVAGALRRSVLVKGSRVFHHAPTEYRPSLILGYTALEETEVSEAIQRIGAAHRELVA